MAVGGTQGTPGKYNLIMSPIVGGNVLGSLTVGANPVYIIGRMSCLKGKLGKKIGPDNLTITDNAIIPEGLNSRRLTTKARLSSNAFNRKRSIDRSYPKHE